MPGLLDKLGSIFTSIAGADDGVHLRVWNELRPWVGNLVPAATRKWLPRIGAGSPCEIPVLRRGIPVGACEHFGVIACDVCRKLVCLDHCRIDQHGDGICYVCVADAIHAVPPVQRERARQAAGGKAPPPGSPPRDAPPPADGKPTPEQILVALKALGLRRGAKWEQVKAAHRKLSAANHPDRAKGIRAKTAAEARFVEVQKAYDLLKKVYPEAA